MSYFDEVTGSNEYQRQSWRDAFNGGRAAGDWTGNHNQRIQDERDAFQGTTWSGSSTQPSALELARSIVGSGHAAISTGLATSGVSGSGNGTVVMGGPQSAAGVGAGQRVVVSGPLKTVTKDEATGLMLGGDWFRPNPWFSNAAEVEDRLGESEVGSPSWFANWGIAGGEAAYNAARFLDWGFDMDIVSNKRPDKPSPISEWAAGDGMWNDIGGAFVRQEARTRQALERMFGTGKVVPMGGF